MVDKATRHAEVTRLLQGWRAGRPGDRDRLVAVVYDELRRIAGSQLARERRRQTFQATDLVHEAFLRLLDQKTAWQNRAHFYGIAARCMRRIVVDRARKQRALKRPRVAAGVDLDQIDISQSNDIEAMLAVDEALTRLEAESPRQAEVAQLRMFAGLDVQQIAELLDVSPATVKRDWAEARRRLAESLSGVSA
jgi:RNA polymerase sigma factor (TIGR02999 family)